MKLIIYAGLFFGGVYFGKYLQKNQCKCTKKTAVDAGKAAVDAGKTHDVPDPQEAEIDPKTAHQEEYLRRLKVPEDVVSIIKKNTNLIN